MKRLILFLMLFLPTVATATDFIDTDLVYGEGTGFVQFWQTWALHKTQLESELNLAAVDVSFTPYSTIGATNTQGAIQEILDEAVEITAGTGITISSGEISVTPDTYADIKADINVLEWHLNSDLLAASATVPDEDMTFRIPVAVNYGTLTVECDGTTHTNMAVDLSFAATRFGTYTDEGTALTATFTHGATAASPIDVSSYGSLTAGQYVNLRVSTASTGDATMCDASLTLINN